MNAFGIAQAFTSWYGIMIMGVLAGLSMYLVALIVVRYRFFRGIQIDAQQVLQKTHQALIDGDMKTLTELRGQRASDPPVRVLVAMGLSNPDLNSQDLSELFQVTRIRQRERLTRGLNIFGTVATISPFIGLLGTVLGIVQSFNSLAHSGAAGPNVVASGVAAALWTTAAGLVVAIPSVVAYNIFKGKAKDVMTDLEVASRELVVLFKSERLPKTKAAS